MNIKLQNKEPSLVDLVGVILNYYYVILITLVIFFVSSLVYVNSIADSKKIFSVNAFIESASYFTIGNGELQKQNVPFHKDSIVADELQRFYPDSKLTLKELNGKISPISISTNISKEYAKEALNGIYSKIVEYQKSHLNHFRNITKNKLSTINSNIQTTEKTMVSLNQLVDFIRKKDSANYQEADIKEADITEIKTLIKALESITDQTSFEVLSGLYDLRMSMWTTQNIALYQKTPELRLNFEILKKIYNLELDLIKLKKSKAQLEFMIDEENIRESSISENLEFKEKNITNHALIVFLASALGIGIGIVVSFLLNLFAVKEKINT
jgi:hypothetical protein